MTSSDELFWLRKWQPYWQQPAFTTIQFHVVYTEQSNPHEGHGTDYGV